MGEPTGWLRRALDLHGVSRRDFMKLCGTAAAWLALPRSAAAQMAEAAEASERPTVIWLEFQDCAGNTESFLRSARPTAADVILDTVSLGYHETIMAAAGHQAEQAKADLVKAHRGKYIAVVEGSIPVGAGGAYCTVGGRTAQDIAKEVCGNALATIAIGTCAAYGGIPAAAPNPTAALGVRDAVPEAKDVINLPACPANPANLTALLLYRLAFDRWPPLDRVGRPLFAYGKTIHDNCERRARFDAGQYAESWGDAAHRRGDCLFKLGCKGPVTSQNCPVIRWNTETDWPIGCGHPCIGCAEPAFWDRMTPFYRHLPGVPGFGVQSNVDTVGLWATVGVAAAFGAHGVVKTVRHLAIEPQHEAEQLTQKKDEEGRK